MVSELELPGAASTRPWVSHLWRKQDCELLLFSLVPGALGTHGVGMARREYEAKEDGNDNSRASWSWGEVWEGALSPGMGLAAGCRGRSILEISWLAGDTGDVSIHSFIWQKKGRPVRVSGQA